MKQLIKSGVYSLTPTIFEELERFGISVLQEKHFYPFHIVWGCEVYFKQLAVTNPESKLQWTAAHELLSIADTSNIPTIAKQSVGFQMVTCKIWQVCCGTGHKQILHIHY